MKTSTAVVVGVVAMFCTTMLGVTLVAVLVPADDAATLIALLLGFASTAVPAVIGLAKITGVERQVTELSNGLMDAKVRAGVADVLPEDLHDPAIRSQLAADRATRDQRH